MTLAKLIQTFIVFSALAAAGLLNLANSPAQQPTAPQPPTGGQVPPAVPPVPPVPAPPAAAGAPADPNQLQQANLWTAGQDGYLAYRIPALVVTPKGTLLAFCEGRKTSRADWGDIDLLVKRSTDGGKTWSAQTIVHEEGGTEKITIGNPAPVVDLRTGVVHLAFCKNNFWVMMTRSEDDGLSWTKPQNITEKVKPEEWDWYATGPGNGIQITRGPHAGRLVIPCDHRVRELGNWDKGGRSHVIYSDDQGATWQAGMETDIAMNECAVAEMADGSLMLNMRSYRGLRRRAVAMSQDGGQTWSSSADDQNLIEPVCQASLLRFSFADAAANMPGRLLFSNPASVKRERMTVRLSRDEGKTWAHSRVLNVGQSAYSSLCVLPDGTILCLYERGMRSPYEYLTLARFNLHWLSEGTDSGPLPPPPKVIAPPAPPAPAPAPVQPAPPAGEPKPPVKPGET